MFARKRASWEEQSWKVRRTGLERGATLHVEDPMYDKEV